MLFTSYQFILFLCLTGVLFYLVPKRFQTVVLLMASYLFYYFAGSSFILYILLTTVTTYIAAIAITCAGKDEGKKKLVLFLCLFVNLGLLAALKYGNFAIHTVNQIGSLFGRTGGIQRVDWVLPLGISFYTFQSVGYLVDVYRGKYPAEKNPVRFALFISFFPQLIQGPIGRFDDLAKTMFVPKQWKAERISSGLQRILWGYFKKLVIADRILIGVNTIIQNPESYRGAYVVIGALFYAFELYADFTGGIDITIGIGEVFGIKMTENFKRPFFSKTVKEYWTRWHITMGTWFKDYVFYPLAVCRPVRALTRACGKTFGRRAGKKIPVYICSFCVWFLTGLWHGASWNFIFWGLGNFLILMISSELEPVFQKFHSRFPKCKGNVAFRMFQVLRTIALMSFLRMFDCYRSVTETFRQMGSVVTGWDSRIFSDGSLLSLGLSMTDYLILLLGLALCIFVSLLQRKGSVRMQMKSLPVGARVAIWYGLFLTVLMFGAYGVGYDATQFIYNQF